MDLKNKMIIVLLKQLKIFQILIKPWSNSLFLYLQMIIHLYFHLNKIIIFYNHPMTKEVAMDFGKKKIQSLISTIIKTNK